jgi:hypothetical protein
MTARYSRSRDLQHRVTVPHSGGWVWGKDQRFEWCKENCSDDYRGGMFRRDQTVWHFKSQQDAMMFALRWS